MGKIVIDAYAWVELFLGSQKGLRVKEVIEEADELYTPCTVLAEIARKYFREKADEKLVEERLETMVAASNIAQIDANLASESAKCDIELTLNAKRSKLKTPSQFEAVVLATGRLTKSKILTGDEHFKNLSETVWIG